MEEQQHDGTESAEWTTKDTLRALLITVVCGAAIAAIAAWQGPKYWAQKGIEVRKQAAEMTSQCEEVFVLHWPQDDGKNIAFTLERVRDRRMYQNITLYEQHPFWKVLRKNPCLWLGEDRTLLVTQRTPAPNEDMKEEIGTNLAFTILDSPCTIQEAPQ
jgi:hypothetical protein